MPDFSDKPPSRVKAITLICLLSAIFGILMGSRSQFEEPWIKTALAAVAGAVMGLSIYIGQDYRRRKDKTRN